MSLSDDVEEIAVSAAKKFDHGELQQLHILYALKKILGERLSEIALSDLEEKLSKVDKIVLTPSQYLRMLKQRLRQLIHLMMGSVSQKTLQAHI